MTKPAGWVAWASFALIVCTGGVARGEPKVAPVVAGPAANDAVYVVSPAGGRVAAGLMKGSRYVVAVDGAEGPPVDSVMMVLPAAGLASPGDQRAGLPGYQPKPINQTPVVFSEDGRRSAYLARVGQEYLVVVDGKEQRRFPVRPGAQVRMQFTGPDGKHFVQAVSGDAGLYEFWVDGERKPAHDPNTVPVFSRDGARYAYVATPDPADRNKRVLVVDGKDAGYPGDDPRFTADGKHVLALTRAGNEQTLLLDGKPAVKAMAIPRVFLAPAGDRFVTVIAKPGQGGQRFVCVADSKEVPATEGSDQPYVAFSPDGRRWAARCKNVVGAFVTWVATDDGKKSQEYNGVADESIVFAPDGSRLAYVASAGPKLFAVIDGKESEGFNYNLRVGFSPDGKKAWYGGRQDQPSITCALVVDGKVYRGDHNFNPETIAFSPDGSRWAAIGNNMKVDDSPGAQASPDNFLIDGKLLAGFTVYSFTFAPNGKHVVFVGQRRADNAKGLFLDDGKPLKLDMGSRGRPAAFSPDGQHLYWTTLQPDAKSNRPQHVVYADGTEVARFDNVSLGNFEGDPGAWQVAPADGTLSAVGVVGDKVISYRVTPGADTSVAAAADAFAAAQAKAKADAEAAKQAAVAAAAKQKADQEAAMKKKQEDAAKARQAAIDARNAAAAARKKAAEDAAAAKKKAAEDAAAAKKAKQPPK